MKDYGISFEAVMQKLDVDLIKLPFKNIKEPEWITMHFWESGDHMWNVGVNTKNIQDIIDGLFIPKDIYILGETYSERQAWVEGAIETVHKKLNI